VNLLCWVELVLLPEADAETQQAIADWHYWVNQGYEFG